MLALYLSLLGSDEERTLFQQMYDAFDQGLFGVALTVLQDQHLAQDAVQDVWMAVIAQFGRVSGLPKEKRGGYLVACVRNRARDILRKRKRETGLEEDHFVTAEAPRCGESLAERLPELILALPESYREVLEQRLMLERSYREIADSLGISEKTVSSRLSRGKAMLIEKLKEEGYDTP